MVYRWNVVFPARTGDEQRTAYLYLPESYDREPESRYPVLYMFDGHNVFFDSDATYGKSWGVGDYLDRIGGRLIVAAVECSHDPDNGRIREYAPYSFQNAKLGNIEGLGEKTMEWMVRVFKAEIDRRCRTLPDREHTFIAGSSMGGLMSLYAVLAYNSVFSRAAALSPSIWTNLPQLLKLTEQAELRPNTVVYMDYGSREMGFHKNMRAQFSQMTAALLERKIFLTSRVVPHGNHCEASWEKQLPFMMGTLLYNP